MLQIKYIPFKGDANTRVPYVVGKGEKEVNK